MRFAYIDSNGNEVPIPSVDALALRIELGAITENTQLYDGQADQWGPAHTHEIFHTLSRDTGGDDGFVAPPPPAPPSSDERGSEAEATPAAPDEAETPPDGGPEEADDDTSFGLTLAEEVPASQDEESARQDEARTAKKEASGTKKEGSGTKKEASGTTGKGGNAPGAEPGGAQADDDLPYLAPWDDDDADEDEAEGKDPGPSPAAPSDADDRPMDLSSPARPESEDQPGSFDFGADGLELEETFDAPTDDSPIDLAGGVETPPPDLGRGMELETSAEFDTGDFEAGEDDSLDLEAPMSDFSPEAPPSWMEDSDDESKEDVMDFSSVGAGSGAEDDADLPLRDRRTPRNKPSPPKLRRQWNLAGPIIGMVILVAVGVGGYVAWPVVSAHLASLDDEDPAVVIPPLSDELMPQMRAAAEAALAATFEEVRAQWAASNPVEEPPPQWLGGLYLANAGDFGAVEEFWLGMSDFLDQVQLIELDAFDAAMRAELEARGVTGADATAIRERADSGFVAAAPARAEVYARFDALISAAVQLHRFLVANEASIEYAPAVVMTTDPILEVNPASDQIRDSMEELLDAVTRALSSLEYRHQVTAEGLRAGIRERIQARGVQ